jgi:hypothetical protein
MRNFRFDTGFITGFDAGNNRTGNYLLNLLLGNTQLLSNLRACSNEFIHNFCRVSLASPCRAEKKYERTLLAGYLQVFLGHINLDQGGCDTPQSTNHLDWQGKSSGLAGQ